MTTFRYFIREKCRNLCEPSDNRECKYNCNKGEIKGAEITEYITPVLKTMLSFSIDGSMAVARTEFLQGQLKGEMMMLKKIKDLILKGLIVEEE